MFIHEAEKKLAEGKKVGRAGWPAGDHLRRTEDLPIELDPSEEKQYGLKTGATVTVSEGTYLYVSEKGNKGAFGYVPTADDRNCSDWQEL
jgi:hypothetical protein